MERNTHEQIPPAQSLCFVTSEACKATSCSSDGCGRHQCCNCVNHGTVFKAGPAPSELRGFGTGTRSRDRRGPSPPPAPEQCGTEQSHATRYGSSMSPIRGSWSCGPIQCVRFHILTFVFSLIPRPPFLLLFLIDMPRTELRLNNECLQNCSKK